MQEKNSAKMASLKSKLDEMFVMITGLEDQVAACDKAISVAIKGDTGCNDRIAGLVKEVGDFTGKVDGGGLMQGRSTEEICAFMRGMSDKSLALASLLMQAKLREIGIWLAQREYRKLEKEIESLHGG